MRPRRLLTLGPDHEPLWMRLYVHEIGGQWAAMIVADEALPPGPGELKGMAFFAETPVAAERAAKAHLGCSEPVN